MGIEPLSSHLKPMALAIRHLVAAWEMQQRAIALGFGPESPLELEAVLRAGLAELDLPEEWGSGGGLEEEDSLFVDMQGPGAVSMTALKEKPETLVAKTARILAMRWLKQACPSPKVEQATKEATNPSPDAYPNPSTNPNPRFRTVTILLLKRPQSRATAQPLLHCRMGKQGEMRPTQPRRQRMPC